MLEISCAYLSHGVRSCGELNAATGVPRVPRLRPRGKIASQCWMKLLLPEEISSSLSHRVQRWPYPTSRLSRRSHRRQTILEPRSEPKATGRTFQHASPGERGIVGARRATPRSEGEFCTSSKIDDVLFNARQQPCCPRRSLLWPRCIAGIPRSSGFSLYIVINHGRALPELYPIDLVCRGDS